MDLDFKKQRNAEFLAKHELTQDEVERLIEEKFNRARAYYDALKPRKDELVESD